MTKKRTVQDEINDQTLLDPFECLGDCDFCLESTFSKDDSWFVCRHNNCFNECPDCDALDWWEESVIEPGLSGL